MKLVIDVVENDYGSPFAYDGRLFEYHGRSFNKLEGNMALSGSTLTIMRAGIVFDQSKGMRTFGAHDMGVGWTGLDNLAKETDLGHGGGSADIFRPNNFKVGDQIIIELEHEILDVDILLPPYVLDLDDELGFGESI
jgi:hypothetical protein